MGATTLAEEAAETAAEVVAGGALEAEPETEAGAAEFVGWGGGWEEEAEEGQMRGGMGEEEAQELAISQSWGVAAAEEAVDGQEWGGIGDEGVAEEDAWERDAIGGDGEEVGESGPSQSWNSAADEVAVGRLQETQRRCADPTEWPRTTDPVEPLAVPREALGATVGDASTLVAAPDRRLDDRHVESGGGRGVAPTSAAAACGTASEGRDGLRLLMASARQVWKRRAPAASDPPAAPEPPPPPRNAFDALMKAAVAPAPLGAPSAAPPRRGGAAGAKASGGSGKGEGSGKSAGRGKGAGGWGGGGRGKLAPFKRIEGTRLVVDGFTAPPNASLLYFLSHFHADHYVGLTRAPRAHSCAA